jgi:hypothetical protein
MSLAVIKEVADEAARRVLAMQQLTECALAEDTSRAEVMSKKCRALTVQNESLRRDIRALMEKNTILLVEFRKLLVYE